MVTFLSNIMKQHPVTTNMHRKTITYFLLLFSIVHTHATNSFFFENISIERGLSSRTVFSITQDQTGFLWVGTIDGLNRFDGYNFKVFKKDPFNKNSLSNSTINCCYKTKDNTLWFGTDKGLNIYNPTNETFSIPKPKNDNNGELATQRIRVLYEDTKNNLWVGTQNGLFKYNRKENVIEPFLFKQANKNGHLNIIRSIYEDEEGSMWIGTFDGLFKLNPLQKNSEHFILKHKNSSGLPNNLITYICGSNNDPTFLWVGTETGLCKFNKADYSFEIFHADDKRTGLSNSTIKHIEPLNRFEFLLATDYGLNLFDTRTNTARAFFHNKYDNLSISDNVVWDIYKDSSGIVWFATHNGIAKHNTHRKNFEINTVDITVGEAIINSIATDPDNDLWFATFDGIIHKNPATNKTNQYLFDSKLSTNKYSKRIYVDKKGNLWAGTNNGLIYWNRKKQKFERVIIKDAPLLLKYIFSITEDEYGNIWTNVNNGLCKISPNWNQSGELSNFSYKVIFVDDKIIQNQNSEISCIYSDQKGIIWFGISNEGLYNYDVTKDKISHFHFDPGNPNSINSNSIISIFSDINHTVYVITDRGLCKYNTQSNNFSEIHVDSYYRYSLQNGIADQQGNIWLTSFLHLLYYNAKNQTTISFDFTHELRNKGFVTNSIFKDKNGKIYLGGYDRYVTFIPEKITSSVIDSIVKPALITNISVFEQDVTWEKKSNRHINPVETVTLKYNQNFVKIQFSLLDYSSPSNNKYAYLLEGVDKQWIYTSGSQNYASYSNLPTGKYTFQLKAANPDGFWSKDTTQLKVVITPPWWLSWWAYSIYIAAIILLLFFIYKTAHARFILAQQLKREKLEREKTEEINTIKLRFFTNISHEFRTPLTLILGPIETLMEKFTDSSVQEQLNIMKTNAERLLRLINQIMDFRKIENKKMELNLINLDIISFTKSIYSMFKEHAAKRNIEYVFDSSCHVCVMSFDNDKIEKVLYNLLSNAFKFTPDNGYINVSVNRITKDKEYIEFEITDNGIGIQDNEKQLIFERFHQVKGNSTGNTEGTGIGLTLSKEFIELHDGEIFVKNNTPRGSVFVVLLPIVNEEINPVEEDVDTEQEQVYQSSAKEKAKLLIIEDNVEMRTYLRRNLEDCYEIFEASDGVEGMESIQKNIPDIIVSDLMMPNMNGLELCEKVKSNMVTSHIPLIILTAKVNEETAYEGFSFGADDYITKPFSMKLLKIRIEKLIEKNEKLREHFRLSMLANPQHIPVESSNEKFIQLLVKAIDKHIDNYDLNIELLCQQLNITHQQVYRKIKALTGQTVNEFIRTVRLKRAAQLLSESDLNISEIMYSVGFSNRSYFSKCFAEEFHMTPKEYRQNNKQQSS